MSGIQGLMDTIRKGVKPKEQKAVRGVIADGRVWVGARSYPFRTAIDGKTENGCRVWVLVSEGGNAVIVGA